MALYSFYNWFLGFFDGNDISGNTNVYKIYKKSIIIQCLISVYENKNLVDEVINYKRIG